jgi:hypothetical protein
VTATGREALRYGLQALRALGLRLTELAQMSPLSVATLKRHTRSLDPSLAAEGASLEKLSLQSKEALTLVWVHAIARGRPLAPPVPQRAFLDFFCSVCLTRSSRPSPSDGLVERDRTGGWPADLTEALVYGLQTCERGAGVCASAPARFAALLLALRVHPWEAYSFVIGEIAPQRWWVRTCLGCERDVVTEAASTRLCVPCRARSRRSTSHPMGAPGGPHLHRRSVTWT